MAETVGLPPAESTSSLRAEAPSFTAGQTREVRPKNLRHLRTNPQTSRTLDAALDYIPFTPSQGIITPSPLAAAHYDQQMLMYPFTPQGPPPAGAFEDALPPLQSISEEGSNNSGQSYTTFSPFRWPMPVSPSAFPVQQEAYVVAGQGVSTAPGAGNMPGMVPVATHDYLYQMQGPPGSPPVYMRSPTPFAPNHSWNGPRRPPSRLSNMHASGPIYLTVPTPGSPVYPSGMNPVDFPQPLNMGMVYPYSNGSPMSSPRWQPSGNLPFQVHGPPTPPRNTRFAAPTAPFRAFVPAVAPHVDQGRPEKPQEVNGERRSPLGLGGSFLQTAYHAEGQVPMNARQRRTARRKAEREAKALAEERARQEATAAGKAEEPPLPATDHSDGESTVTGALSQADTSQTVDLQS